MLLLLLLLPRTGVRGALTSRAEAQGVVEVLAAPGEEGCRKQTEMPDVDKLGRGFPIGRLERGSWGLRCIGIGAGWCEAQISTPGRCWWATGLWYVYR